MELQQLFSFGGFVHHAEHDISHVAKEVEPIAKYAAGKAWMGTKACYANATCKASVEKVGIAATEAAFALQNLNFAACNGSATQPSYCKFMGGGNQTIIMML